MSSIKVTVPYKNITGAIPMLILMMIAIILTAFYIYPVDLFLSWTWLTAIVVSVSLIIYFLFVAIENFFDKNISNDWLAYLSLIVVLIVPALIMSPFTNEGFGWVGFWIALYYLLPQMLIITVVSILINLSVGRSLNG